ncbi:MAG: hypothetical protein CMK09_04725 [Ponticaulis sp.]|nr:hypothetical protein [Ponticaulis sp.]|tara:strand:- start:1743 stop:2135 length:393 start_codon:yes stop_codon:yes gene_type:complete
MVVVLSGVILSACSTSGEDAIYTGYYRQVFETNDFYTEDGDGPYWMDFATTDADLRPYFEEKPGRGSHTTVRISFRAHPTDMPEFAYSEMYRGQLSVTEILSVEKLDENIYFERQQDFNAKRLADYGDAE